MFVLYSFQKLPMNLFDGGVQKQWKDKYFLCIKWKTFVLLSNFSTIIENYALVRYYPGAALFTLFI